MDNFSIVQVPRAQKDLAPLKLDMTTINSTLRRIGEIASVTPSKAQELVALFNIAYLDTGRLIAVLEYEYEVTEKKISEAKAILLFDSMAAFLQSKGLATSKNPLGSEDIRNAVYANDPEISRLVDNSINIKAHLSMLRESKKALEMAYNGTKKVMGDPIGSTNRQNPYLVTEQNITTAADRNNPAPLEADFFGVPQYNKR